jgi:hypothetical protein
MAQDLTLIAILEFLRSLGLQVDERPITRETLVSGVDIIGGGLVIDEPQLCKPADVLHEAAHILLTPATERAALENPLTSSPAEEMSAIAWTWAAALQLRIDPSEVFHQQVLSGNGPTLLENFSAGRYVGVPMLQYWGLTLEPARARERGQPSYPHMLRWARS